MDSLKDGAKLEDFDRGLEAVKAHLGAIQPASSILTPSTAAATPAGKAMRGRAFSSGKVTVSLSLEDYSCDLVASPGKAGGKTLYPASHAEPIAVDPVAFNLPNNATNQFPAQRRPLLRLAEIAVGDVIGRGAMGVVYRGMVKATGQQIAVKVVQIDRDDESSLAHAEALDNELRVLQELDHPRIVRYLGHERIGFDEGRLGGGGPSGLGSVSSMSGSGSSGQQAPTLDLTAPPSAVSYSSFYPPPILTKFAPPTEKLVIFCEYLPGGSIAAAIRQFGAFEEQAIASHSRQILEGLKYVHDCRVSHRDLKGDNILLDLNGCCKLADFGCAKKVDLNPAGSTVMKTLKGSIPWMAPEVILGEGYGRPADIYALGCVVLEMATGKHPWVGRFDNVMQAMYRIAMCEDGLEVPSSLSANCRDFVGKCILRNPKSRPTAAELLEHPFVK